MAARRWRRKKAAIVAPPEAQRLSMGTLPKKFAFGKYAGVDIRDIPSDYLQYVIESNKRVIADCQEELERREAAAQADLSWIQRVIETGYRELAKKIHPDAGGDNAGMAELNAAVEALREVARR